MAEAEGAVQLTDLEVIQQFSLAVRGATASRAEVVAALESDLAWLRGEHVPDVGAPRVPEQELEAEPEPFARPEAPDVAEGTRRGLKRPAPRRRAE